MGKPISCNLDQTLVGVRILQNPEEPKEGGHGRALRNGGGARGTKAASHCPAAHSGTLNVTAMEVHYTWEDRLRQLISVLSAIMGRVREAVDRLIVFGNREPILTIRRVLWVATAGLWLGILYVAASLVVLSTLVFAPFALQVLRIARFALDGGITLEPYTPTLSTSLRSHFWNNPAHPYTIAANIAWAVLLGWAFTVMHLTAAVVHALTIVGIGTAITNVEMAAYVIWPFGRELRRQELPTTLADLYLSRMPPTPVHESQPWV